MEDFFPESKKSAQEVTSKKRKVEKQPVDDDLRKRARLYCVCPEQWRSVSRYNKERLETFVQENQFKEEQHLHNTVFDFVQRSLAWGFDLFSRGGGFVRTEIENDLSLRTAIVSEAGSFVSLLSNRVRILSLLATDTMSGKMNQAVKSPQIVEIKNDDPLIVPGPPPGQSETATMPSFGETTGDQVLQQAECDDNLCEKGDGQDRIGN